MTSLDDVTFVFCTCRRLQLYRRTLASVREHLEDFGSVSRVLVIDDNSSDSDRALMRGADPFFEFIFKGVPQIGHAKSLNWMLENVRTPYVAYWEDDCELETKGPWLSQARQILRGSQSIVSVSFDPFIAADDRGACAREWTTHERPFPHRVSVQKPLELFADPQKFNFLRDPWPGFSLKPNLMSLHKVRDLVGRFDETNNDHMEYDFGLRCLKAGLHTAVLTGPIIKDISQGRSAYVLNGRVRTYDSAVSAQAEQRSHDLDAEAPE